MHSVLDQEILRLIGTKSTENRGYTLLMNTFQEQLYHLIYRMTNHHADTDDILQNTFIKVFRGIKNFEGNSKLSTWLFRIATNEALTFLNKKKRVSKHSDLLLQNTISRSINYESLASDQIIEHLQSALNTLPEKQKLIFTMRYYNEMTYQEISDILGTTVGGLKASYHHAVKKIEHHIMNTNIIY